MKKQLHIVQFIIAAWLLGTAMPAMSQTWTTGVPADGTYFLYNEGFKGYLTNGNNWGTRASLSQSDAAAIRLEKTGENVYTLHTSPAYPDGKLTLENGSGPALYLDQTAGTSWTITEQSKGRYTITNGGKYVYGRSDTKLTWDSKQGNSFDYWKLLSRENYVQDLVKGAASGTPMDATFLLPSNDFNKNTDGMWGDIRSSMKGDVTYRFAEFWNRTFDFHQTISDIPNGRYRIHCQGFYRLGGGNNSPQWSATGREQGNETINAYFYANNEQHPFPSIFDSECTTQDDNYNLTEGFTINGVRYYVPGNPDQAGKCFSRGDYKTYFEVIVTNNKLTIGAKCSVNDGAQWSCVKGFRLEYLGSAEGKMHELGNYVASITEAKMTTAKAPTSLTISYPYRLSTDGETITLSPSHGITVDGTAVQASIVDEQLVVDALPKTVGEHTITIPAGAFGYITSGVTNAAITIKYTLIEGTLSEPLVGYLYTTVNDAPRFLSRGADWSTRAVLADYGLPVRLSESNGNNLSNLQSLDWQTYLFANSNNEIYTDGADPSDVTVVVVSDGVYQLKANNGRFISASSDGKLSATTTSPATATKWQFMDKDSYSARQAALQSEQRTATLTAAGITEADLAKAYLQVVKTSEDTQTASTEEPYNTAIDRTWSLTGLEPGLYMVQLNAFMRNGELTYVQTLMNSGFDDHLAHLTAGTNSIRIMSAWEGGQPEPIVAGTSGTLTYNGEMRYVPQNSVAVNYLFNNTSFYNNQLLVNVPSTGRLTIRLSCPGRTGNNWMPYRDLTVSRVVTDFDGWEAMNLGDICIENPDVKAFLDAADYQYLGQKPIVDNYDKLSDRPRPISIPVRPNAGEVKLSLSQSPDMSDAYTTTARTTSGTLLCHYNGIPGHTYYYMIETIDGQLLTKGRFNLTGTVRMLYTDGGSNMRDLGGRITVDGKRVRYGRIFRGGELHAGYQTQLSADDIKEMQRLGITAELDLRRHNETEDGNNVPTASAIPGASYYFPDIEHCDRDLVEDLKGWNYHQKIKKSIEFIANGLRKGGNVYFHCIWGADRTGAWGLFINSILGCQFSDIEKDYQLTSFSKAGLRPGGLVLDDKFAAVKMKGCKGNTLQEQIVSFLTDICGVSKADIQTIRDEMLEDGYEAQYAERLKVAYAKVAKTAGVEWTCESTSLSTITESFNAAMKTITDPRNITALVTNANLESGYDNWCGFGDGLGTGGESNHIARINNGVGAYYKTLQNMPAGTYIVKAQAFNRKGIGVSDDNAGYQAFLDGLKATSFLQLNDTKVTLRNLYEDFRNTTYGNDYRPAYKMYVPENSTSAAAAISADGGRQYWNVAVATLDKAGDLTIGIVSPVTQEGDYTVFDNVKLYYCGAALTPSTLTLTEDASSITFKEDGIYNVTSDITLKPGQWNDVCLPFDMTPQMMAEAHITEARRFDNVQTEDGQVTVTFVKVDEMKAAAPYVVKVSQPWKVGAQNVVVRAKSPVGYYVNDTHHNYFVTGTYQPRNLAKKFLLDGNKFSFFEQETPVKCYHSYITLTGLADGSLPDFDITPSEPTAIDQLLGDDDTETNTSVAPLRQGIYDLQGRRLSTSTGTPTARHGIYIIGGKKVVR